MRDLVESILLGDNVEASRLFESHMDSILEKKLYEAKRCIDISEVVKPVKGKPGEFTGQNTKADWAKYRKQHPAAGMYDVPGKRPGTIKKGKPPKAEKTASGGITKHGIEVRRKAGYVQAHPALKALEFIKRVRKYKETGKIEEQTGKPGPFQKMNIEPEMRGIKSAGTEEPSRNAEAMRPKGSQVKPDKQTTAADYKRRAELAKAGAAAKKIKAKSSATPVADRYSSALERAQKLERRGRAGSVAKIKKAYLGHRMKQGAKAAVKGAVNTWSNILQKGMTGPLEE